MAGITDLPFRNICRDFGAGLATSEMLTSITSLWHSKKSQSRLKLEGENGIRALQIAGSCPKQMAEAAKQAEACGAQIIDINMGCPAKKVCNRAAGSALLRDESLVGQILRAVVEAVEVPATLKIRTGWSPEQKNATRIASIAEAEGIKCLTIHGRTRACRFKGEAEYDTIAEVTQKVAIPVIANGDIGNPDKARDVLAKTGAAAIMLGRGARGRPWIFREITNALTGKNSTRPIELREIFSTITTHLNALYDHYGEQLGARIARKHITWYLANPQLECHRTQAQQVRQVCNSVTTKKEQLTAIQGFYQWHSQLEDQVA